MNIFDDLMDAIGDVIENISDVLGSLGSDTSSSVDSSLRVVAEAATDAGRQVGRQAGRASAQKVSVKVNLPKARITWNKDRWEGTKLEDYFDRGELLGYELANDVMSHGVPNTDGDAGGGCWATLKKGSDNLLYVKKVYILQSSRASGVLSLAVASSNLSQTANALLRSLAVKTINLSFDDWWDNGLSSSLTRSVSLAPGSYVAVAEIPRPSVRKWCAPTRWWSWTQTGPRANKSTGYMREHCTSHLTKFKRTVSVSKVSDYSKSFTVSSSGRQGVTLKPVASLGVGNRTHFETAHAKAVYVACTVGDWFFDLIVKNLKGD